MSASTFSAMIRGIASLFFICFMIGQMTNVPMLAALCISFGVLIIVLALLERYT